MCTSRTTIGSILFLRVSNLIVTSVRHSPRGENSQVIGTNTTPDGRRIRASPIVNRWLRGASGVNVPLTVGGLLTVVSVDALSSAALLSSVVACTDAVL